MGTKEFEAPILDLLGNKRVVEIREGDTPETFVLVELCDMNFEADLTAEQLRALGHELIDIADGKGKLVQ